MKTSEIKNLLSEMKNDPRAGGMSDKVDARITARVFSFIDKTLVEEPANKTSVFNFIASIPTILTDVVARPMAFASLLVVMVLGGWITSVNASLNTLPGDVLYPVKLVSEKAQLTLASDNTKTRLHEEFAARRLNEITALVNSSGNKKHERVQVAINGFNKQIDSVNAQLKLTENKDTVVELARIIDQKTTDLEAVLEMSDKNSDSHDVIEEAIELNDEIGDKVVETLVQQSEKSSLTRDELSRQFTNEVRTLKSRTDTLEVRVERILNVAKEREDVDIDIENIRAYLVTLDLSESMNYAAQGGYQKAFNLTGDVKQAFKEFATQLTELEIQLTSPVVEAEDIEQVDEAIIEETDAETDSIVEHNLQEEPISATEKE